MKSIFRKLFCRLEDKDVRGNLRDIFRDVLTGTTLITPPTTSSVWMIKFYGIPGWFSLFFAVTADFIIFTWVVYSVQFSLEKVISLEKKVNRLFVVLCMFLFQVSITYSIINIITR